MLSSPESQMTIHRKRREGKKTGSAEESGKDRRGSAFTVTARTHRSPLGWLSEEIPGANQNSGEKRNREAREIKPITIGEGGVSEDT